MTPDKMRELADRLDQIKNLDMLACEDVLQAADFLRQCAAQKPVGWRKDLDPPRGNWTHWMVPGNPWPNSPHVQALYTAPVPQPLSDETALLRQALARIDDMLIGDDGQAFKEARKFAETLRTRLEGEQK